MKLRHFAMAIGILSMFALAGCGEESSSTSEGSGEAAEPAAGGGGAAAEPAEPAAAEQPAQPAAGGGGSLCARARDCCQAYVNALPAGGGVTAATACAGIQGVENTPGADTACQNMINGWRTSLQALPGATVPAACQ